MVKVLLVDDEVDFLKVIKKRMESWDCIDIILEAHSGVEALNIIKEEEVDIVVLDYMMPKMDGIETLKELRKINPKQKVIMFTGYPADENLAEAMALKVDAFIPKFSDMTDVQSSLRGAVCGIAKHIEKKV
jgi:CheY-like chemotaxis protein